MLAASTIGDWRRFGDPRFRTYHYLAVAQGVVGVLASFDVIIPFALSIGCPPFLAVLLGAIPLVGGVAQLAVPRLLDRTNGNLRGLTLFIALISEPRGLWLAGLAALIAAGVLSGPIALVVLIAIITPTSILTWIVGANLLSWHSAVLPEPDRRLVVPRLLAVSLSIGALLLLPLAFVLDGLVHAFGPLAYALPFAVSGTFGLVEILVVRRLRHPGRVIVPPRADASPAETSPELTRFMKVSTINAAGMGLGPSMSVFIISVIGLSAGFSVMVSSIGTLTQVVAAVIAGTHLERGSSSRMLRSSFSIRAMAMTAPLFVLPLPALAPVFLISSSMLGAVGFVFGSLAANEKMFRLITGPAVIRQHARYLAATSGAMTGAQVASAAVIAAAGPLGYAAFGALYAGSALLRVVAYRQAAPPAVTAQSTASAEAGVSAAA